MSLFEQLEKTERWLAVIGYEGCYEVSNWARVRSLARKTTSGRILSPRFRKDGYLSVHLSFNGKYKTHLIHKLVIEAFIGPCPVGKEVDHKDKDKSNNLVSNLRYITHAENSQRKKLTPRKIWEIRRLYKEGFNYYQIAKQFDLNPDYVNAIISYRVWANI